MTMLRCRDIVVALPLRLSCIKSLTALMWSQPTAPKSRCLNIVVRTPPLYTSAHTSLNKLPSSLMVLSAASLTIYARTND